MPIVFTVDHDRREVHSIAIGPVTFESVRSHLMQERHWRGLAYPELVDARGAGIDFTSSEVREAVHMLCTMGTESRLGPTAILVSSDAAYGIVRMVEMLVDDCAEIKPFRDEPEARAWLASKSPADPTT